MRSKLIIVLGMIVSANAETLSTEIHLDLVTAWSFVSSAEVGKAVEGTWVVDQKHADRGMPKVVRITSAKKENEELDCRKFGFKHLLCMKKDEGKGMLLAYYHQIQNDRHVRTD